MQLPDPSIDMSGTATINITKNGVNKGYGLDRPDYWTVSDSGKLKEN